MFFYLILRGKKNNLAKSVTFYERFVNGPLLILKLPNIVQLSISPQTELDDTKIPKINSFRKTEYGCLLDRGCRKWHAHRCFQVSVIVSLSISVVDEWH